MNVLIDIILVILLAYFIIRFSKSGFLISLLGLGKPLASIMIAFTLCQPMSEVVFGILVKQISINALILRIISSVFSYAFIFVISFLLISIIINIVSKIKIPVISKIDRSLGALFGFLIGFAFASMISNCTFSVISTYEALIGESEIMNIYNDSLIFKIVYNLKFFDFIKELI